MNPNQSAEGRQDQANRGFPGRKIPRFVEGENKPSVFSATDVNVLVDEVNRLLNAEIRRGPYDAVIHTDTGVIYQIAYSKGDLSAITAA